jgi:hypothetical protein
VSIYATVSDKDLRCTVDTEKSSNSLPYFPVSVSKFRHVKTSARSS